MLTILIITHLACCVLSYGMCFADFEERDAAYKVFTKRENIGCSILVSLFGPLSLIIIFLSTGFAQHGIRFK